MVNRLLICIVLLGLSACSTPAAKPTARTCEDLPITSTKGDFTLGNQTIDGVTFGDVALCSQDKSYYIKVDRPSGKHTLAMGRKAHGELHRTTPPTSDLPPTQIQVDAVFASLSKRAQSKGIDVLSGGLGSCGDIKGDINAWKMSIVINNWKQADAAVQLVADELRRWDIRGHLGVSVMARKCDFIEVSR